MTAILKDLRHAVRALLRTKGWTAVVLLSLALGIGANTALFTAVNGVMFDTVSVSKPDALVRFNWYGKNDMVRSTSSYGYAGTVGDQRVGSTLSYPMFLELKAHNETLTDVAGAVPSGNFNVLIGSDAQLASASMVTGAYFRVIGVGAALGRVLGDDDDAVSAPLAAVISYKYWQKRFGGDAGVINRVVSMNNQPVTIVGVTPESFNGVMRLGNDAPEITVPLAFDTVFNPLPTAAPGRPAPTPRMSQTTTWWLMVMGRLKPGATIEQAQANFATVFQNAARTGMEQFQASLSDADRGLSYNKQRGTNVPNLLVKSAAHGFYDVSPNAKKSAGFLAVVVVVVLLIVCANVANLLLSRATTRSRELAIRLSIGATRGRLIRQLLTESVLLACLGGALGVVVGYWMRGLLPFGNTAPIDWTVAGFVAGVSMLTGIVFGLAPAVRATGVDLAGSMKESSRSVTSSKSWLSRGLLILQVAMALVLLVGAGLFLKTLNNLRTEDVGFNTTNLLTFTVNPGVNRYDAARSLGLFQQSLQRLSAVPGVVAAGLTRTPLLAGSTSSSSVWKQGQTGDQPAEGEMYMMTVSPGWFGTMGIPTRLGRICDDHDMPDSPKVAVINETAAHKLFPDGNVIGARLGFSLERAAEYQVIGVVKDVKYSSLRDPGPPTMYQCAWQQSPRQLVAVLRTAGDPMALTNAVRAAMREIDPTLPIDRFTSQSEDIEGQLQQERLFALAYSMFGGLALVLASIGLFGLMSYNVSRRTNEIGIRMALGAQRGRVIGMVMGESLMLVGIGVAIGVGAALWAGRFVTTVLYGLDAHDRTTFMLAVLLILVVSGLAGYLPARRASKVDPMTAVNS